MNTYDDILSHAECKTLEFKRDLSSPMPLLRTLTTKAQAGSRSSHGAQSGAQSDRIILALSDVPLSSQELIEILGLDSKTGAFKRSIKELLEQGMIEYTIPEKPASRLQQYRLTERGREFLKKDKNNADNEH